MNRIPANHQNFSHVCNNVAIYIQVGLTEQQKSKKIEQSYHHNLKKRL